MECFCNGSEDSCNALQNLCNGKGNISDALQNLCNGKENISDGLQDLCNGKEDLSDGLQNLCNALQSLSFPKEMASLAQKQRFLKKNEEKWGCIINKVKNGDKEGWLSNVKRKLV